MNMSGTGKVTKKRQKFAKVSEIEYKILFLQNKGSPMSEIEERRLASLLEQKTLHEDRGLESLKNTKVPIDWIGDRFKEISKEVTGVVNPIVNPEANPEVDPAVDPVVEDALGENKLDGQSKYENENLEDILENNENPVNSEKIKKTHSNAFLQFMSEKKSRLVASDPTGKLDLDRARSEWKSLSELGKTPFKRKAEEDLEQVKNRLGGKYKPKPKITTEEKKKRKRKADEKYRSQ